MLSTNRMIFLQNQPQSSAAKVRESSAVSGMPLQKCRAFPLIAECCRKSAGRFRWLSIVLAKVREGFKLNFIRPPNWSNNPLAAETSSRLEEQSAGFNKVKVAVERVGHVTDAQAIICLKAFLQKKRQNKKGALFLVLQQPLRHFEESHYCYHSDEFAAISHDRQAADIVLFDDFHCIHK